MQVRGTEVKNMDKTDKTVYLWTHRSRAVILLKRTEATFHHFFFFTRKIIKYIYLAYVVEIFCHFNAISCTQNKWPKMSYYEIYAGTKPCFDVKKLIGVQSKTQARF